ncbi:hypothetical protein BRADI_2g21370v3 [Brachypodium distachyon]|nr:hypothetical protein BRADI_2g21370v3 [Brachypodium distachyon]PNT71011.1 hypothetical protein BRADI_2g21370v3 [Brachypodium distachyon]PNT71012.1 hypothetical protein BRADI_2g21370v3 [Brachypodium distachyon]PNT71013.1 hypothetical protein BRADI_2g21370v3 [Brachypodium distachyon]
MENYLQAGGFGAGRGFLYPPPLGVEGTPSLGLALAAIESTGGMIRPLSPSPDDSLLGGYARLKISDALQSSPPRCADARQATLLSPVSPLDVGGSSPQPSPMKRKKLAVLPYSSSMPCEAR